MTQEQKNLLLKDLSARLPYGVKFALSDNKLYTIYTIKGVDLIVTDEGNWEHAVLAKGIEAIEIKYVKPYLRPMLSITEEEIIELNNIPSTKNYTIIKDDLPWDIANYKQIDWLNAHHFDYRGLIEMGLAIEALEGMYN